MFDSPFDFFAIVIAIVAFIIARKAMNEVAALRAQLALMQGLATPTAAVRPVPPPLTPFYGAHPWSGQIFLIVRPPAMHRMLDVTMTHRPM